MTHTLVRHQGCPARRVRLTHDNVPTGIFYRAWQPSDSPEEVTTLLHRAFDSLGKKGIHCASGHQSPAQTLARLERGRSFVAIDAGRIVGTLTLYAREIDSHCPVYRDSKVASIHQFAVDPDYQGMGIGDALLSIAECAAKVDGCTSLALDTPKRAKNLRDFYHDKGFRSVDSLRFAGRRYISLVLLKPLCANQGIPPATAWL